MSICCSKHRHQNGIEKKIEYLEMNPRDDDNSYLCNQLGNALFCVTSGIFAGRAQRDPAKSHELHKISLIINYYCVKISSR
jgi:hypothetical protein